MMLGSVKQNPKLSDKSEVFEDRDSLVFVDNFDWTDRFVGQSFEISFRRFGEVGKRNRVFYVEKPGRQNQNMKD